MLQPEGQQYCTERVLDQDPGWQRTQSMDVAKMEMMASHQNILLVAIWTYAALLTVFGIVLIFCQRRQFKNIRNEMDEVHAEISDIDERLTLLEEVRKRQAAA